MSDKLYILIKYNREREFFFFLNLFDKYLYNYLYF